MIKEYQTYFQISFLIYLNRPKTLQLLLRFSPHLASCTLMNNQSTILYQLTIEILFLNINIIFTKVSPFFLWISLHTRGIMSNNISCWHHIKCKTKKMFALPSQIHKEKCFFYKKMTIVTTWPDLMLKLVYLYGI
jgi:hypothetical protein